MALDRFLISLMLILPVWSGYGTFEAAAQQASMQGIISDHATGQPLVGANVVLNSLDEVDRSLGSATDRDGFYRIGSVIPGSWTIRISFVGYATHLDTVTFSPGENRTLNLVLEQDETPLEEVIIEPLTGAAWREDGAQRITPADMRRVPGPSTGDIAAYLQTLPGVVAMGDRGGQLFIRGGTPSENKVLVDGALIYQPVHIVGFYSPFSENIVAGADFYSGGFGARYTDRLSSVLDIQLRHGNRFTAAGSASASPFAAEISGEGPIRTGQSSWMFSVRNSLIEQTSSWYPIERQPLKFESRFFKASRIDTDGRCSAMVLNTYDRGLLDFDADESIRWSNLLIGGRCVALPEGTRTLMDVNVSLSRFRNTTDNDADFGFTSRISRINMDVNLRHYLGEIRLDYGIQSRFKSLNYDLSEKFVGFDSDRAGLLILGTHFSSTIPVGQRFRVQPGFAITLTPDDFKPFVEPRLRATWQPLGRDSEEVTGSVGLYRQRISGVSDMRDINSVFVAWMDSPAGRSQMSSIHATLGWQQLLPGGFTWSAEAYYKALKHLAVPVWSTIARFTTDLAEASGRIYGSDLRLEYSGNRFYGMIGYGYSMTLYESAQDHFNLWFGEPVRQYHPPHDRRHQLQTLFNLVFGRYTAGLRWQFGSGLPFTRPLGFDEVLDFREQLPNVMTDRGTRRVILDMPYDARLPAYHRLDISLERTFRVFRPGAELTLQVGAINLYDKTNIFYYDIYTHRRIDQLPFVPYFSLTAEL